MQQFTEELRYIYPVTASDDVLDIGGYEGKWGEEMHRRYGCRVLMFEPCKSYFDRIIERLGGNPNFRIFNHAIGNSNRVDELRIKGDMTGLFADGPAESISVIKIDAALSCSRNGRFKVAKVNSEGSEYEILEYVLAQGLTDKCDNWQIQFHTVVDNYEARRAAIYAGLEKAHKLTYNEPYVWCNFELR
jgi:FkbM family methyltransferase